MILPSISCCDIADDAAYHLLDATGNARVTGCILCVKRGAGRIALRETAIDSLAAHRAP